MSDNPDDPKKKEPQGGGAGNKPGQDVPQGASGKAPGGGFGLNNAKRGPGRQPKIGKDGGKDGKGKKGKR